MDTGKDLGPIPQQKERESLQRQISRANNERQFVLGCQELIDPLVTDYTKSSFLRELRQDTIDWQIHSSGTEGEIVARWVGLGLLEDFPEFTEISPFNKGSRTTEDDMLKIERLKDGKDSYKVRAIVEFSNEIVDGERKRKWAIWNFNLGKESLEKRTNDCEAERLGYENQIRILNQPKVSP